MNPQDQNQQNNFSLNRDASAGSAQVSSTPSAGSPAGASTQAGQVPFMAFPANQPRDYDMGIKEMIFNLVERKYRPTAFIANYQRLSAQDAQKYPPLDENTINMLKAQGQDITEAQRDFEIARVYNKLEIDIFMMSTSQLPQDKQDELRRMTEQAQMNPTANQNELIAKIKDFMQMNVPNITMMVDQYMKGFTNEYLAGHY
jgi:hypothetical protein